MSVDLQSSDRLPSGTLTPQVSPEQRARLEGSLKRLDALAALMDDRFEIPLIKTRVGLDALLGLIPGGGDWAAWLVGVYIFWEAARLGAPLALLARMAAHIGVDLLGGYAPIVGDVFDVLYRSNKRNVELLRGHFGARQELGAPLPAVLPERAARSLERPHSAARYGFALLLSALLLLVATGPFLILYLFLRGA